MTQMLLGLGSARVSSATGRIRRGERAGWKARPLLRIRCSGVAPKQSFLRISFVAHNAERKKVRDCEDALAPAAAGRDACAALPADGLVVAQAAFPHETCPGPREEQPADLNRQRLHEIGAL